MTPDLTVQLLGTDTGATRWFPQLAVFAGAVLGASISIVSTFGLEAWRDHRKTRRLALAIASEVEAAVRIITFRRYVAGLGEALMLARDGKAQRFQAKIGDGYLPVSNGAADMAGAFPGKIGFRLSELLGLTRAIKLDMDELGDPASVFHTQGAEGYAFVYDQLLMLMKEAVALSVDLVNEIDRRYNTKSIRTWATWGDIDDIYRNRNNRNTAETPSRL